jgi:hypothetical protein
MERNRSSAIFFAEFARNIKVATSLMDTTTSRRRVHSAAAKFYTASAAVLAAAPDTSATKGPNG